MVSEEEYDAKYDGWVLGSGSVVGIGYQGLAWDRVQERLWQLEKDYQKFGPSHRAPREALITVVFHVKGGPLDTIVAEFQGFEPRQLSKTRRRLQVDVSLPRGLDEREIECFVADTLVPAVEFAGDVFAKRKLDFDTTRALGIAHSVSQRLRSDGQ